MRPTVTQLIRLECHKATDGESNPLRIVIGEDDLAFRKVLCYQLANLGHVVVGQASDGNEAVRLSFQTRPDLVIMDINMPKMDGVMAVRRISEELNVPIVFCTGLADEQTLQRVEKVSAHGYLVKPFLEKQLKTALRLAVAQHRRMLLTEIELSGTREELETVQLIDKALGIMSRHYGVDREAAKEQMESAANAWKCSLRRAAAQVIERIGEAAANSAATKPAAPKVEIPA